MRKIIKYNGKEYKLRKDQPYYCNGWNYLHRQVYIDNYGPIPEGYDVHHIDHDTENNDASNLAVIHHKKHRSYHAKKRVKENPEFFVDWQKAGVKEAAKWHSSEEGIEWHKNHWNSYMKKLFVERKEVCDNCEKEYITNSSGTHDRFCSNKCKSDFRRKSGVDDEIRICPVCNESYTVNKYKKNITCGRSCANRKRKIDRDIEGLPYHSKKYS
jgi:hypothetical protein